MALWEGLAALTDKDALPNRLKWRRANPTGAQRSPSHFARKARKDPKTKFPALEQAKNRRGSLRENKARARAGAEKRDRARHIPAERIKAQLKS